MGSVVLGCKHAKQMVHGGSVRLLMVLLVQDSSCVLKTNVCVDLEQKIVVERVFSSTQTQSIVGNVTTFVEVGSCVQGAVVLRVALLSFPILVVMGVLI